MLIRVFSHSLASTIKGEGAGCAPFNPCILQTLIYDLGIGEESWEARVHERWIDCVLKYWAFFLDGGVAINQHISQINRSTISSRWVSSCFCYLFGDFWFLMILWFSFGFLLRSCLLWHVRMHLESSWSSLTHEQVLGSKFDFLRFLCPHSLIYEIHRTLILIFPVVD